MRCKEVQLTDDNKHVVIRSFHSALPPQQRPYREHHHTECELSLFLSGSGIYSVHGKEYAFSPGDVFLFGSNEAHCITRIDADMDLLNIHFEPKLFWDHPESAELWNIFAARSKDYSHLFPASDPIPAKQILQLEQELIQQQAGYPVNARYLLFSTLIHLIRNYPCIDPKKALSAPNSVTKNLTAAVAYIRDHLSEPLTLKELAEVACMAPTYFSSVFKKYSGISPFQYITIKRVEMAIEMLKTTAATKLEIAQQCGFSSASNFYKAFFAVTGKKPGDYSPGR